MTDGKEYLVVSSFQFPSNGKVDPNWTDKADGRVFKKFQFPSNGKVDPNATYERVGDGFAVHVSIPFKRESGS